MRRLKHSSKRGFSLVEMMLALAIIIIIGWTTAALMIAIKDSFMTTYNTNDSTDYAVLYGNGIENTYLKHTQAHTSATIKVDENSLLRDGAAKVFEPYQMSTTLSDGSKVNKWAIRAYYNVTSTDKEKQIVQYRVYVVDNYYSPNYRVMSIYEGTIWAPHMGYNMVTLSNSLVDDDVDEFLRGKVAKYKLTDDWKDTLTYTYT